MMTTRGRTAFVTVRIGSDNHAPPCARAACARAGYSMNQPWLTMRDWPVNAFVFAAAKKSAASATSSVVVNPPSTVSFSITLWTTSSSEIPSAFACSGICLSTRGVRTKPGQNDVRAHPMLDAFLCDDLAEADQAVLRGDVRGFAQRGLLGVHRSDIDDRANLPLIHMAQAGLRGQERAVKVDCEHLLPFAKRKLVDRLHDLDAGIANENVHPAVALGGSGNARSRRPSRRSRPSSRPCPPAPYRRQLRPLPGADVPGQ